MKTTFAVFLLFFFSLSIQAQIHTVDNGNPGADYTDLQDAIDNASEGDTIYVAGSFTPYGNISVNKQLTIFGDGYYITGDRKPTELGDVSFVNGSSQSHIAGVLANSFQKTSGHTSDSLHISDSKAKYCLLQGGQYHKINGNIFEGNHFSLSLGYGANPNIYNAQNVTVENNIIYSRVVYSTYSSNLIQNNTFLKGGSNPDNLAFGGSSGICKFSTLVNNIFYGTSSAQVQVGCTSCSASFNAYYHHDGSAFVGDNPLFVNPSTLSTDNISAYSADHDVHLQQGSPAIGAGQGGFDQGATGGADPFIYGGFAPIPRVISLTSPTPYIEAGQTIQVNIEAVSKQ